MTGMANVADMRRQFQINCPSYNTIKLFVWKFIAKCCVLLLHYMDRLLLLLSIPLMEVYGEIELRNRFNDLIGQPLIKSK